jgi:hypothetical protein
MFAEPRSKAILVRRGAPPRLLARGCPRKRTMIQSAAIAPVRRRNPAVANSLSRVEPSRGRIATGEAGLPLDGAHGSGAATLKGGRPVLDAWRSKLPRSLRGDS